MVLRAELLRNDEVPGELIVRVYIPEATGDLATGGDAPEKMDEFRHGAVAAAAVREAVEFTDAPGASVIALPDDGWCWPTSS